MICGLSDRQFQIIKWMAKGCTNKEIGNALGVSVTMGTNEVNEITTLYNVLTKTAAVSIFIRMYLAERSAHILMKGELGYFINEDDFNGLMSILETKILEPVA